MPIEYVLKCLGLGFNPEKKSYFLVYFNRATICVLMLWLECSFRNYFTPLWQKPLLSIFQAVNLLLNQPALQPHFTLISPHYSKRNFKSVSRATFPHWVQSRTTDAQRESSLHCTAENSFPLPDFFCSIEAHLICQISPIFQISLIYAFIGCP